MYTQQPKEETSLSTESSEDDMLLHRIQVSHRKYSWGEENCEES